MSTTERLRALLDERGVEYRTHGTTDRTWFEVGSISWFICERENGSLTADAVFLTPEQAIAATLGRGECHITDNGPWGYPYVCSACGASFDPDINNGEFNYCPSCGRKVVGE